MSRPPMARHGRLWWSNRASRPRSAASTGIPLNGASAELAAGEYGVLSACDGCRALDEHEARAAAQLAAPSEHRSAIREVLERCARRGLLMAVSELVGRFGAPAASGPQGIAAVV